MKWIRFKNHYGSNWEYKCISNGNLEYMYEQIKGLHKKRMANIAEAFISYLEDMDDNILEIYGWNKIDVEEIEAPPKDVLQRKIKHINISIKGQIKQLKELQESLRAVIAKEESE